MINNQKDWCEACTLEEKTLLIVVQLAMQPISIKKVNEWISATGVANKKYYTTVAITDFLLSAKKMDILLAEKSGYYVVADSCKNILLDLAVKHVDIIEKLHISYYLIFPKSTHISTWTPIEYIKNIYIHSMQGVLLGKIDKSDNSLIEGALQIDKMLASKSMISSIEKLNNELLYLIYRYERFDAVSERFALVLLTDKLESVFSLRESVSNIIPIKLTDTNKIFVHFQQLISIANSFIRGEFERVLQLADENQTLFAFCFKLHCLRLLGRLDEVAVLEKQLSPMLIDENSLLATPMSIFLLPNALFFGKLKKSKLQTVIKEVSPMYRNCLQMLVAAHKNIEVVGGAEKYRAETYKIFLNNCLESLCKYIGLYWTKIPFRDDEKLNISSLVENFHKIGAFYYELEFAQLAALACSNPIMENRALDLKAQLGVKQCLCELYTPPSDWDLKLKQLCALSVANSGFAVQKEERLVWMISPKSARFHPVLQKAQKNGGWSSGRNVALAKLKERALDCLTPQDNKVIDHLKLQRDYYNSFYEFEPEALDALVGHPLLFHADAPTVPLELEANEVHLIVEENRSKCTFSFSHELTENRSLQKISMNKYSIVTVPDAIREIAKIIGLEGMSVPIAAKPQVLDALKHLSGAIKIQSPLMGEQTGATRVEASLQLYIHLLPVGNGIRSEIFVKPFETEPPYLRPTEGLAKINTIRNDIHIFTERIFSAEKKQVALLMERCPVFASQAETEMAAHFDNPADCLQVLSELREATDLAVVEWPRGQRFSLRSKLTFNSFSMSVKKQNNWFDVNGSVQVDEQTVLDLKKMLQLLETSQGRFIEIEDGVYIELEKHFIRQLEYLKTVADVSSKGIKLHPLAAATNAGLFESAGSFEGDKEWNKFIDKIRKTENIKYQLPKGVDAELRPYQEEGYRWLRKMADWGTGACLADDMGLGKTLQCLTLLQSRVKEGPSMVVAPSSVCRNWMSEIEKFTPSMQAILFGGVDRKQMVETLEGGAILIVSYGLLHTEAELLTSRKWNVLILDEAHAIKNISTKRSQAAMSIDADFKIAATGTPLQNHMGELWNLFQFLNPGLLGSQQSFIERFVTPIERSNSELARRALKDLIKPFILRRTKNQVLTELPEKTEITISVELSDEERAFYEALRVKALEDLQKLDDTANAGEKQLRVLAEIMKLRRACCHPSLANKAVNIESSKLQRFEELVDTLIENGHKALVFSQFVGHLELMRELLDNKSISYEYLDGSTPGKEREESIRRFQAGSTDLFLISLKAGGVGLNLTAADYVIHMDPWWNPAVEDQASDRAHRIGQTKPVTIYRLVAKDTIEDRIVELHKNKRDLADSLLEGTEGAGKVTADELVALLKGM